MKTICITIAFEKQTSCSITMTQLEGIGDVSCVGGLKFDYGGDIGQEVWMVECFIDNNEIGFNLDCEYNFKDEYEYFLQYFRRKNIATKEELRLAPLWCSSFVRDLSNRILNFAEVHGGVKHCSINTIVEERKIVTAGYLGIKFCCIFGTTVFKREAYESDAYALDRLHFGPYAAEIDPLNISIGKDLKQFNSDLGKNHNEYSIKRIAITLLDAGSQFVFANANTTGFITNCAEQMEKSLTAQRAESFTSFLVKERISSPISLNYSPQEETSFFIRYLDESIGVHNALDESLQIPSNNTLPSLASASKGLRLGLAENFRFITKAIEEDETANARLYFYPINHGASLYFFPAFILFLIVGSQLADSDRKIESNFLPIVRADFSEALTIEAITLLRRAKQFACQSAIGSIMSRNGSHNIGSHVLAALSHNVGTMPDDRVLYQYIQQRMDYIANVTTESPSWAQPTMLVGELIRAFLSQRHLLDHIAESEGLSAWEFQNRNTVYDERQKGKIKIHVRKVKRDGCTVEVLHDFIKYATNEIDKKIDLSHDMALAIPGGVAGQHAFFTILENIIRNAAKHDWSNPPPSTKHIKDRNGNLEVHIDFEDKEDSGQVEFNIWTNMSDILEDPRAGNDVESDKALHKLLAAKLAMSFIDDNSGSLRRANWGLAEMKISVGYLQGRKIAEIGGIDKRFESKNIIDPHYIEDNTGVKHLAYRFCVPKPKMLLFLLNSEKADEKVLLDGWKKYESEFKRQGIYAKTYSEVLEEAKRDKLAFPKLDYEYVVMDYMGESEANWFLPFRVMTIKPTEVEGAKNIIPHIDSEGWKSCAHILNGMVLDENGKTLDDESIKFKTKTIVDKILACWCKFMKSRHMKDGDEPLGLVLTVREDNNNFGEKAGRGLISKGDVVAFVIREAFNSTITSYIALNRLDVSLEREKHKAIIDVLERLKGRRSESLGSKVDVSNVKGETYRPYILEWLKQMLGSENDESSRAEEELRKTIRLVKANQSMSSAERDSRLVTLRKQITDLRVSEVNGSKNHDIELLGGFVDYMVQVCSQMETVLCKYAENIVSLPKGFGVESDKDKDNEYKEWNEARLHFWKGPRKYDSPENLFDETEKNLASASKEFAKQPIVEFVRHYDPNTEDLKDCQLYAEPLSGSQSYLNILERCTSNDKQTIAKLIETASLRILVIDERVAKFHREHANEVARTYRSMHIYVADDKKVDDELLFLSNPPKEGEDECRIKEYNTRKKKLEGLRWKSLDIKNSKEGLISLSAQNIFDGRKVIDSVGDSPVEGHGDRLLHIIQKFTDEFGKKLFDVLIIHQGIIDKWFPGTANDSKRVEKLLTYLRQIFPYVVITTGRGSPANIPDMARMVPFSTIETTLFKKYPEKMLLVDAIMNVLPKGAISNG